MNDQSVPYHDPKSLDNSAPRSPKLGQIQVTIGLALQEAFEHTTLEGQVLCKALLVSQVQLNALFEGDARKFHSYGIYLRSLRSALDKLLPRETEIHDKLAVLERHYLCTPRGSEIRRLKKTNDTSLVSAPGKKSASSRQLFGRNKWIWSLESGTIFLAVALTAAIVVIFFRTFF